ncbi:MAG: tRNA threonylcarbamoyladenosine dehydratase [Clostridia bacterium]|nr:tRNA threonylcarbamoyladenosine dehydratase [Clostridia bacterium]
MEETWTSRTEQLIGKKAMEKLKKAKVVVFGIGGVGSFVVEGLVRAGLGHIVLVDQDIITISNLNRQIHATSKTLGKKKTEVMKQRILDINPELKVEIYEAQEIENEEELIDPTLSYVVDAVDTVKTKLKLVEKANEKNIPIISCMGTGNKLDPAKFEITDIKNTSVCPLARVIRKELKKRNIEQLKVLYSKEIPKSIEKQTVPGSIAFVPSVAGLMIAGEVIREIIKKESCFGEKE